MTAVASLNGLTVITLSITYLVPVLSAAVHPERRLPAAMTEPVQGAIAGLMSTLSRQYIQPSTEAPPIPDIRPLRAAGIPLIGDAELRQAAEEREDHRNLLGAFVHRDGWEWKDVMNSGDPQSEAAAHLKEK